MLFLKSLAAESKIEDEAKGIVHAVIAAYEQEDGDGDTMVTGAFTKSIGRLKSGTYRPVGLAYHKQDRPVAKTLDMWEKDQEIHVIGQYNLETQDARDVFSNIKHGITWGYSHGFVRPKVERMPMGKKRIHDLDLKEWSPVSVPALESTHTLHVKGLLRDGSTFDDQVSMALDIVEDLAARAREIEDLRTKESRHISQEKTLLLKELADRLAEFVLAVTPLPDAVDAGELQAEVLRHVRNQQAFRALRAA